MVRVHSLRAIAFGALVLVAAPRAARADGAPDAAGAKDLFDRGRDLRARGNCADALPLFQRAYALYPPGLGSLRNIAVCQEVLGHFASARSTWLELRRAVSSTDDPKYAGWGEDADRAMAHLAPKVAALTVDVAVVDAGEVPRPATPEDGIVVSVDGKPLPPERLGAPVDHNPGTIVVRAEGPTLATPDEEIVTLGAGDAKRLTLRVALATAPPSPKPAADEEAPPPVLDAPAQGASPVRTAAWVALGVGVAGLAGTATSFVLRQSALSDLNAACPGHASGPCPASSRDAVNSALQRGQTASTLLNVFLAAGIAGTAASFVLFTVGRSTPHASAVVITPAGVGATGTF
jgi:hypothetical protein